MEGRAKVYRIEIHGFRQVLLGHRVVAERRVGLAEVRLFRGRLRIETHSQREGLYGFAILPPRKQRGA